MSKIEIKKNLLVTNFNHGITLISSHHDKLLSTPNVAQLFELPFSVYFLDKDAKTVLINEEGASVCGFQSAEDSMGKTLVAVSEKKSAGLLIDNCHHVIQTQATKIFDEENIRQDNKIIQFISVKMPWYNNNNIIGLMGISIVLGKHSLSDALSKLSVLGFLNQDRFIEPTRSFPLNALKIKDVALTKRELQCLQLTVKGFTAKKIARYLGISFRTVEEYLTNVRQKSGVNSKSELIELAIENVFC